ncbi:MAG: hypothetical protein Kow0098_24650 [Ignavibacteriaceae bacterium]
MHITGKKYFIPAATTCLAIILISYLLNTESNREAFDEFMTGLLGKTNKWSNTYGSEEFVNSNKDISALGGQTLIGIFSILIYIGLNYVKKQYKIIEIFIPLLGAGIFLMILKAILSDDDKNFYDIITLNLHGFPSGHAFASAIFYFISVNVLFRHSSERVRYFLTVSVIIITVVIGISRILSAAHTPMDVAGGWAAGILWLLIYYRFLEMKVKKISKPNT